jgi:hypothetical protein
MAHLFFSLIFQRNRVKGLLGNLIRWDAFVPARHSGKSVQSVSLRSGSKGQVFFPILLSVAADNFSARLVYVSCIRLCTRVCVEVLRRSNIWYKGPMFRSKLMLLSSEKQITLRCPLNICDIKLFLSHCLTG